MQCDDFQQIILEGWEGLIPKKDGKVNFQSSDRSQ
jgi:hypothetical protein